MYEHETLFIGGRWAPPNGRETLEVHNPATTEVVGRVPVADATDVDRAVQAARRAFEDGPWGRTSPAERREALSRLAEAIRSRAEDLATVITQENGSPISWSHMGQVLASQMVIDYYVGLGDAFAFEEPRDGVLGKVLVRSLPVGVVGGIVAWNVPLFVTMTKLAPALLAGCTVVLKPAPETPLNAYLLAEAVQEAGLPEGVVNVVPGGAETGEALVAHPGIDKISFTGSVPVGKKIAATAGAQLKRVTLELGGKSAAIVLDDADLDAVADGLRFCGLMNTGQACVAQTRVLAPRSRYTELVDRLAAAMEGMKIGDPMDPETEVGPLISERQRDRVEGYIASGQQDGAKLVIGGDRPDGFDRGWWVEPTLFAEVDNAMRIAREEIFGPVLAVIPYGDDDEAVKIANDSPYGLAGSVWTGDPDRGVQVAGRVRTGITTVNGFSMDFAAPFGGFKESGVGRELGPEGLRSYLEYQTVHLPA